MSDLTRGVRAAVSVARAQGCTCDVEVHWIDDTAYELRHDDWCPLLRVVVERGPGGDWELMLYRGADFDD